MGEDQGEKGEVGFTPAAFNLPNWILACGVRVMRMNDSCIALAISREASQTTAMP
jgi:hypothetical protein